MRVGTRPGRRRGATALEFALVLPVLMTLALGCLDFGRLGHNYIAVSNAARAGAGYGSSTTYTPATYNTWLAGVRQAAVDEMSQTYGFDSSKLSVTTTVIAEAPAGWRVQVDVSYPFQTAVSWPGIPSLITLRQVVVMESIR